ncbi:MAG: ACT domain-containing protein [Acidobacteriota bacterium]
MTRSEGGPSSSESAPPPWKKLAWLPGAFAVCRLSPDVPVPIFPGRSSLYSVTRTDRELSIVCEEASAPEGAVRESGWRALRLEGPIPFSVTGVLAALSAPLARAGLPIFVVSTYDTDYLLVRDSDAEAARAALEREGFTLKP